MVEENSFTRNGASEVEPILSLSRLYAPPRRHTRNLHAMLARSLIAPLRAAARPAFAAPSRAFSASRLALDTSSSPKPSAPSTGPVNDASTANAAPSSSSTQQNRTQAGVSHLSSLSRTASQSLTDPHHYSRSLSRQAQSLSLPASVCGTTSSPRRKKSANGNGWRPQRRGSDAQRSEDRSC